MKAVPIAAVESVPTEAEHSISKDVSKLSLDNATTFEENAVEEKAPNPKVFRRMGSSSYIRAHDLEGIPSEMHQGGPQVASSVLVNTMREHGGRRGPCKMATEGFYFVDEDLQLVLDELSSFAFSEATDESTRFVPGRETNNILRKRAQQPSLKPAVDPDWPVSPWHAASPANLNEILIWNSTTNKKGFGQDWPIVKARGIIPASPRTVCQYLWDSKNVRQYNNMSVGRHDVTVFQEGVDTRAEDSPYGFAGCAKILKSHNKIKMVPRIIEIVSILHARPLESAPGTYMIVNRSIWESDTANENQEQNNNTAVSDNKLIRSEMLLGVQLLRPLNGGKACEITTVTHAVVPGMNNGILAKTAANVSAAKILRTIQAAHMK